MKIYLCFLFLFCLSGSLASGDYWPGLGRSYDLIYDLKLKGPNYYDREDYDKDDHILRPCSIHDLNCIRQLLILKSICSLLSGPTQDPFIIKKLHMDMPHSNVTITIYNAALTGLNTGKIEELFINKKTDTLILEVVLKTLTVDAPKTVVTYYRKGKEPTKVSDQSNIVFEDLSLTLIVRHVSNPLLSKSYVYAYLSKGDPPLKLGPRLEDTQVAGIPLTILKWKDDVNMTSKEGMVTAAPTFLVAFLQTKICNAKHYY